MFPTQSLAGCSFRGNEQSLEQAGKGNQPGRAVVGVGGCFTGSSTDSSPAKDDLENEHAQVSRQSLSLP